MYQRFSFHVMHNSGAQLMALNLLIITLECYIEIHIIIGKISILISIFVLNMLPRPSKHLFCCQSALHLRRTWLQTQDCRSQPWRTRGRFNGGSSTSWVIFKKKLHLNKQVSFSVIFLSPLFKLTTTIFSLNLFLLLLFT